MRGHTDRAEAEMAVHVAALTKPVGELIEAVLHKHHRAVLGAVKELHDRCIKAERQRDELAEALRHMSWCRSCADGSWQDCDGGRDALSILARLGGEGGEG